MNRNLFRRLFLLMAVAVMLFAAGCTPEAVPRDAGSMAAYIGEDGLMLYRFDDQSNTLLHRGRYLSAPAFAESGQYVYFRGGSDMFCVALDGSPDFKTMASAYGIPTLVADDEDKLDEVLDQFLATKGSCLLICEVHPDVGTND